MRAVTRSSILARARRDDYYALRRQGTSMFDAGRLVGVADRGVIGRYERHYQAYLASLCGPCRLDRCDECDGACGCHHNQASAQ